MSQETLFEVCRHNLQSQLESVLRAPDPEVQRSAQFALVLLRDLHEFYKEAVAASCSQVPPQYPETADTTNYRVYELLASFGLSQMQLLSVAQAEGLHEMRKLRMLRTVYGLSLPQAEAVLVQSEESN